MHISSFSHVQATAPALLYVCDYQSLPPVTPCTE